MVLSELIKEYKDMSLQDVIINKLNTEYNLKGNK